MDLGLYGKRALITASSSGLGFAAASRLAREGCSVVLHARGAETLRAAGAAIERETGTAPSMLQADLAVAAEVERLADDALATLGGLDILVVNSGHMPYGTLDALSDAEWRLSFELVTMSAVRLVRRTLPALCKSRGAIVFIGSTSTKEPKPHHVVSNVMRAGVAGLAKTLAKGLLKEGVRVNSVAPGFFDSGRVKHRISEHAEKTGMPRREASVDLLGPLAMDRVGEPHELGDAVAFLASPLASFITGATLAVDGGSSQAIF
jgi:3-oxoacyl-[acyl-carrier protein] reductase